MTSVARAAATSLLAAFACAASAAAAPIESRFMAPSAGDVLASGVTHEAHWLSLCPSRRDADEMELLLSVDGGRTFPIRLTAELPLCASSFRWKVPAVSSDEARLAVRVGRDGHAESEEIVFVSPTFRITAFAAREDSDLVVGPSERWTEQALSEIGAEDLLGGALRGSSERLEAPVSEHELEVPPSGALSAVLVFIRRVPALADAVAVTAAPARVRPSAPVPLRE